MISTKAVTANRAVMRNSSTYGSMRKQGRIMACPTLPQPAGQQTNSLREGRLFSAFKLYGFKPVVLEPEQWGCQVVGITAQRQRQQIAVASVIGVVRLPKLRKRGNRICLGHAHPKVTGQDGSGICFQDMLKIVAKQGQ